MYDDIMSILLNGINFALSTFYYFVKDNFLTLFMSMFLVFLSYKFFLRPLIGGQVGSDLVKRGARSKRE